MRKFISAMCVLLLFSGTTLSAYDDTFIDYQNYDHGYCPECNSAPCACDGAQQEEPPCDACDPCAPVCGTSAGSCMGAIVVALVAIAAGAAIVLLSSDGSANHTNH